ncbi:MAG: AAA family ATPase [Vicinamibacteria bacterium]|nr:AAA family ATPase [Vicinamibacteria bacterium]
MTTAHPVYAEFYGLEVRPFNLTPDPSFLYLGSEHHEAMAHLEFGLRERGGFILLTGEVGTGKTTLLRHFLSRLGPETSTAVILYPSLSAIEMLRAILSDLHLSYSDGATLKDLVDLMHAYLLEARSAGRAVVLVIDEAQDLSPEVLEQIRLISNLETETEKLIQIVLVGQTELRDMLARRELRQLAQRITARYHLAPLERDATEAYIAHRLRVAGGEGKLSFAPAAVRAVQRASRGIPRLINLICDRTLLAGYVAGERVLSAAMVRRAVREALGAPARVTTWPRSAAAGVVVALLALIAFFVWDARPANHAAVSLPAPTAAPAIAVNTPATMTSTSRLDTLLIALPRDSSWSDSLKALQARWGARPVVMTTLRAHLDQVQRLDLPAVLEMFHPARRDTCFLALLRIEGATAFIADGAKGAWPITLAELDRYYTRQAAFAWRDEARLLEDEQARAVWTHAELARRGYREVDLVQAVTRFQREQQLAADGAIGARTLMTLYALTDSPRPRLSRGTP